MRENVQEVAAPDGPDDPDIVDFRRAWDESRGAHDESGPRRALAVAASLDGLWEWDLKRGVLHYSDRCAELLGYRKDEIPHAIDFFWNALHPEDVAAARAAVSRCLEDGTPTDVECRLRAKEGEYPWFRARGRAHRDEMGRASTMAGTLQDVSDRKRAEIAMQESERRFRTLCERSLAGIYIVQDGSLTYANAAMGELLASRPGELDNVSPLDFVHPDDRAVVEDNMRRRLQGEAETTRYEARYLRKDGSIVHVEVLGSRIEYRGGLALIGTILDVSDGKRAQAAMEERLRFEKLLADLSASFVSPRPEEADPLLDSSLKTLVEFLGNDRSTLVQFTDGKARVLVTHSYAVSGCEPYSLGPLADDWLPWYIGQFRSGKTVFMRRLPEDLPPEADQEKRFCIAHGIQSSIAIPLKAGHAILGALTFAFIKRRCEWPEEIICRLRVVGEVFANALQHRRADKALRAALAENEKLRERLQQENQYLRDQVVLEHRHGRILGQSDALKKVLVEAERVAVTDTPVLLLGETGTGKELLAQTIHELSARKGRPMIQASFRIVVPKGKREEVLDVLQCLQGPTEVSPECHAYRVLQDVEDKNVLTYLVVWESQRALEEHFRSELFRRLLPYIEMSREPPEFNVSTLDSVGGMEFLVAVLGSQAS